MDLEFPVEFLVHGTPVSLQVKHPRSREEWKERVRAASKVVLPDWFLSSEERIAVTLYYLPEDDAQGDLDNIVKPILDALGAHIYIDDEQVDRLVVQRFKSGNIFEFRNPSMTMLDALTSERPVLYVRVSNDPLEDFG